MCRVPAWSRNIWSRSPLVIQGTGSCIRLTDPQPDQFRPGNVYQLMFVDFKNEETLKYIYECSTLAKDDTMYYDLPTSGNFEYTMVIVRFLLNKDTVTRMAAKYPHTGPRGGKRAPEPLRPPTSSAETDNLLKDLQQQQMVLTRQQQQLLEQQEALAVEAAGTAKDILSDVVQINTVTTATDQRVGELTDTVTNVLTSQMAEERQSTQNQFSQLLDSHARQFSQILGQRQQALAQQQQSPAFTMVTPGMHASKRPMYTHRQSSGGQVLGGQATPMAVSQGGSSNLGHSALLATPHWLQQQQDQQHAHEGEVMYQEQYQQQPHY
jgi:hypothetical protein